jgi:molecular chaperone DnaK (HSP70)
MTVYEESKERNLSIDYAVGIDLGTTYSCVTVYQNERIMVVADENGHKLIPSVVALIPCSGEIEAYVGHEALEYANASEYVICGNNNL